ncbi:MAG: EAL domain-containing protein [Pelovirga sp.]
MNTDYKHPVFRILVIDDNQAIHEDFRKILMQNKKTNTDLDDLESALFGSEKQIATTLTFELDVASQGAEGLAMVEAAVAEGRPYSLAFVDGRMPPGWDGIETIGHLWQADPDLQTVLCTAYADYSWQEIRNILGETDSLLILKKPFDNIEVLQLAHALTRKWEMSREIKGKLHQLAYYDFLTGLPNRGLFLEHLAEHLEKAKSSNKPGALLFIDLDNFKRINDTLGHVTGDELLKIVAQRLAGCVRDENRLGPKGNSYGTSRLGGDEFAILLHDIDSPEIAETVAQRVLKKLSAPIELGNNQVIVTPSIGIALFPTDGDDITSVLKNADLAMYFSKRNGANTFQFYQESMNADALKRMTLETQLRQALQRDEFSLVYQPQFDTQTGVLSGLEALLRWNNHELGQVPPLEFISVAEDCGFIILLREWVLRTACRQAQQWIDEGVYLPRIGVNVSPQQFLHADFETMVASVLQDTGLEASRLQLEITETLLLKDPAKTSAILNNLTKMGVGFAIDDFGTGYSNLSRLRELPINCLKVDRSFVSSVDTGLRGQTILSAIIAMGAGMDMGVWKN